MMCLFLSNSLALAKNSMDIKVSKTFSMDLPFQSTTPLEMPSLNSKLFKADNALGLSSKNQLLVVHNKPLTLANKYSVERYWDRSRKQTRSFDQDEKNQGCAKFSNRVYQCSRDVYQNGKYISESIYWNTKSDLVLLRVSSNKSTEDSRKILSAIKIQADSRLPAGETK